MIEQPSRSTQIPSATFEPAVGSKNADEPIATIANTFIATPIQLCARNGGGILKSTRYAATKTMTLARTSWYTETLTYTSPIIAHVVPSRSVTAGAARMRSTRGVTGGSGVRPCVHTQHDVQREREAHRDEHDERRHQRLGELDGLARRVLDVHVEEHLRRERRARAAHERREEHEDRGEPARALRRRRLRARHIVGYRRLRDPRMTRREREGQSKGSPGITCPSSTASFWRARGQGRARPAAPPRFNMARARAWSESLAPSFEGYAAWARESLGVELSEALRACSRSAGTAARTASSRPPTSRPARAASPCPSTRCSTRPRRSRRRRPTRRARGGRARGRGGRGRARGRRARAPPPVRVRRAPRARAGRRTSRACRARRRAHSLLRWTEAQLDELRGTNVGAPARRWRAQVAADHAELLARARRGRRASRARRARRARRVRGRRRGARRRGRGRRRGRRGDRGADARGDGRRRAAGAGAGGGGALDPTTTTLAAAAPWAADPARYAWAIAMVDALRDGVARGVGRGAVQGRCAARARGARAQRRAPPPRVYARTRRCCRRRRGRPGRALSTPSTTRPTRSPARAGRAGVRAGAEATLTYGALRTTSCSCSTDSSTRARARPAARGARSSRPCPRPRARAAAKRARRSRAPGLAAEADGARGFVLELGAGGGGGGAAPAAAAARPRTAVGGGPDAGRRPRRAARARCAARRGRRRARAARRRGRRARAQRRGERARARVGARPRARSTLCSSSGVLRVDNGRRRGRRSRAPRPPPPLRRRRRGRRGRGGAPRGARRGRGRRRRRGRRGGGGGVSRRRRAAARARRRRSAASEAAAAGRALAGRDGRDVGPAPRRRRPRLPQDRRDARARPCRAGRSSETVIGGELETSRAYGVGDVIIHRHRGRALRDPGRRVRVALRDGRGRARAHGRARGRGLRALPADRARVGAELAPVSRAGRGLPAIAFVALGRAHLRARQRFPRGAVPGGRRAVPHRARRVRAHTRATTPLDAADAYGRGARAARTRCGCPRFRALAAARADVARHQPSTRNIAPRAQAASGETETPGKGERTPASRAIARRRAARAHASAAAATRAGRERARRRAAGGGAGARTARGRARARRAPAGARDDGARARLHLIARRVAGAAAAAPRSGTRGSAPRRTRSRRSIFLRARRLRTFQRAPSTRRPAGRPNEKHGCATSNARARARARRPRGGCGRRRGSCPTCADGSEEEGESEPSRYIEREQEGFKDGTNARRRRGGSRSPLRAVIHRRPCSGRVAG